MEYEVDCWSGKGMVKEWVIDEVLKNKKKSRNNKKNSEKRSKEVKEIRIV